MPSFIVKIDAPNLESLDSALNNALDGDHGIDSFYILVEGVKSLAHFHTDEHMEQERREANDLANTMRLLRLSEISGA
jgi:hypothetical protein